MKPVQLSTVLSAARELRYLTGNVVLRTLTLVTRAGWQTLQAVVFSGV